MTKTMAILGTGPALSMSVARRFGREGFHLALIARNAARLDAFVGELAEDGIEATAFPADMTDLDRLTATLNAIGRIDVALYNTTGVVEQMAPVLGIDVDNLRAQVDAVLMPAISLVRLALPQMRERGDGAFLFSNGVSAVNPMPMMGNLGIACAGLRNHAYMLNAVLADEGIYAGTMSIGAVIDRGDIARTIDSAQDMDPGKEAATAAPRVNPDDLADLYWDMYAKRDRVEEVVP